MKKSLSFSKGITNVPSDLLSEDTELVETTGAIYRNGEMHPLQKPTFIHSFSETEKLMFVHKTSEIHNILTFSDTDKSLRFYKVGEDNGVSLLQESVVDGNIYKIVSVNNIVCVFTDNGILFFIWKNDKYVKYGSLPELGISFQLIPDGNTLDLITKSNQFADLSGLVNTVSATASYYSHDSERKYEYRSSTWDKTDSDNATDHLGTNQTTYKRITLIDDKVDDVYNACEGNVSLIRTLAKEKGYFLYPFFLRYAFRLFDGTYTRISNPIAVFPSITRNGYLTASGFANGKFDPTPKNKRTFAFNALKYKLQYTVVKNSDLDVWKDIIDEIVVFASDEVLPFRIDKGYDLKYPVDVVPNNTNITFSDFIGSTDVESTAEYDGICKMHWRRTYDGDNELPLLYARCVFMPKEYKTEDEIRKEMIERTVFYKLFSVKISDVKDTPQTPDIKEGVLDNLTSQEQLPVDDYYGWTTLKGKNVFTYNKRVNVFDASRSFFKGFNNFTQGFFPSQKGSVTRKYFVHIVKSGADTWVCSDVNNAATPYADDSWLYYPDPYATEIVVWDESILWGITLSMEKHPRLNGAYSFLSLPLHDAFRLHENRFFPPVVNDNVFEDISSQIFTSVVNNPFVFEASGDNTVGTGAILGIAANTEPISQGQFGQYPLIVFTTEGIYGMSVNSEGLYSASYPISREVCNNAESITPTGSLVFFTSAKGLMVISGGSVACMSDQMRGRDPSQFVSIGDGDFLSFLKGCSIAYDYRDSLLHIYSPNRDYHYIYSIPDHTFAMSRNMSKPLLGVASAYPDTLVQEKDGAVYSLLSKPDINADTARYSGTFTSRPLKLDSSTQLKTIHQILHLYDSADGTLSLRVYGSNDCRYWNELKSLHGKPWKYFTFQYAFANFSAADSFAGTLVDFQPRFTAKMR